MQYCLGCDRKWKFQCSMEHKGTGAQQQGCSQLLETHTDLYLGTLQGTQQLLENTEICIAWDQKWKFQSAGNFHRCEVQCSFEEAQQPWKHIALSCWDHQWEIASLNFTESANWDRT